MTRWLQRIGAIAIGAAFMGLFLAQCATTLGLHCLVWEGC